jgi:hypothetical protein
VASSDLPEAARELLRHFADLPREDRERILALVRSLSICRTAELYSMRLLRDQGSAIRPESLPV